MIWTGEREGVAFASNRDPLERFVRAFRVDDVLHVALADGSTCGWDAGVAEIAGVILDAVESSAGGPYRAPLRREVTELFTGAQQAFLRAAAPYPEDEDVGGSIAQLTLLRREGRRLSLAWAGFIEVLIVSDKGIRTPMRRERPLGAPCISRIPARPEEAQVEVEPDDLVLIQRLPFSGRFFGQETVTPAPTLLPLEAMVGDTPQAVVSATVRRQVQHDEERRRRGSLIGEPPVTVAAFRA